MITVANFLACTGSWTCLFAFGLVGLTRQAIVLAVGTSSWSSSKRFCSAATTSWAMPVTLPPGRLKLAARPIWAGAAAGSRHRRKA